MGQGLGYKVAVAAIPTVILSKHLLRSKKNALGRCHDGKECHNGVFLDAFQLILLSISLKVQMSDSNYLITKNMLFIVSMLKYVFSC